MDGRESLWELLRGLPVDCQAAIERACRAVWNCCAASPRVTLLPGVSLFAGTNTFALLLLWHAETASVRPSPAGLLLVATALVLAGLAQMGRTLLATAGWRATAVVDRVLLGLAIAFPGVALAGFGLRSSPPGALGALMVTLLAV
ncbi:MAG: hypothetical protein EHM42_09615, partial [Planctomycetaceae bacterium]